MNLLANASRPSGAPARAQRSGSRGERRSKGAAAVFAARRKRRQADFATTRRMPSDAAAALWLDELEGLE